MFGMYPNADPSDMLSGIGKRKAERECW